MSRVWGLRSNECEVNDADGDVDAEDARDLSVDVVGDGGVDDAVDVMRLMVTSESVVSK